MKLINLNLILYQVHLYLSIGYYDPQYAYSKYYNPFTFDPHSETYHYEVQMANRFDSFPEDATITTGSLILDFSCE